MGPDRYSYIEQIINTVGCWIFLTKHIVFDSVGLGLKSLSKFSDFGEMDSDLSFSLGDWCPS